MLVTVATFLEPAEAHIVRGLLQSDGIPASIAHEGHVTAIWPLATALGGIAVQVSSSDLDEARALIEAYQRDELGVDPAELDAAAADAIAAPPPTGPVDRGPVCANCGSIRYHQRVPLRQKLLAVTMFLFGGASFPTRSSAFACLDCGNRWIRA